MNYTEIIEKAQQNLKEKELSKYLQTQGAETGYVSRSNSGFFKTLAFKMRMIDTEVANTEFEIFGQRLKTPIMSAALDYAAHPLEILPGIKKELGDSIIILVDSGFRRGTDILKALALGADGVLIGRLLLMALAANEAGGVKEMLQMVTKELQRTMSITGCKKLKNISETILYRRIFGSDFPEIKEKLRR